MKSRVALFLGAAIFAFTSVARANPIDGGIVVGPFITNVGGDCLPSGNNLVQNPGFECYETVPSGVDPSNNPLNLPLDLFLDFPGWTSGGNEYVGVVDENIDSSAAPYIHGDLRAAFLGDGSFSQTLSTVSGQYYEINFWYRDPPTPPGVIVKKTGSGLSGNDCLLFDGIDQGQLTASFGGTQLFSTPSTPTGVFEGNEECMASEDASGYKEITSYDWGTGSDVLSFSGLLERGDWVLDDVSVVAVDPQTLVPLNTSSDVPEPATLAVMIAGLAGAGAMRRRKAKA
jgi:PEP-CTERM motif